MKKRTQIRNSKIGQSGLKLAILILVFIVVGCVPAATQVVDQSIPTPLIESTQVIGQATPTPISEVTLPSGFETYTNEEQCGYAISHPQEMDVTEMTPNSWSINFASTEPNGPFPNFVYISVIPDSFQGGPGEIYNYDPAATELLLNMQVGESKSIHANLNVAEGFTYTRLADATLSSQVAQTYENNQPWEFPPGTKEIRYYLNANGCTYMIGGYFDSLNSGQPRGMSQELFEEIIATFEVSQ